MEKIRFTKGFHKIAEGIFAYLQPNGSWGLNNAGIVVTQNKSLLIDTLYDLKHTNEMRKDLQTLLPKSKQIPDYVFNTHSNGDHWYGNVLFNNSKIISTKTCLDEMKMLPPKKMNTLMSLSWFLGKGGRYAKEVFKEFDYRGITPRYPDETFREEKNIDLDGRVIKLIEVGPAHTKGDAIAYIPDAKVVFAGDFLFIDAHPIVWEYPLQNIIDACKRLLELDAEIFVPGHGPVTDRKGVEDTIEYFEYIYEEGKRLLKNGMSLIDAAGKLELKKYSMWREKERVIANLYSVYRELNPEDKYYGPVGIFKLMKIYKERFA